MKGEQETEVDRKIQQQNNNNEIINKGMGVAIQTIYTIIPMKEEKTK